MSQSWARIYIQKSMYRAGFGFGSRIEKEKTNEKQQQKN